MEEEDIQSETSTFTSSAGAPAVEVEVESTVEVEVAVGAVAPVITMGRTKRYLQKNKTPRTTSLSPHTDPNAPWGTVDCVFCNFPWGENIFEYFNETENILTVLGSELKTGCECAFITKELLPANILMERGFSVTEIIPIGDDKKKDRKVPYSKKNKGSDRAFGNDRENTGDCFITFAVVL